MEFTQIANTILNGYCLQIGNVPHRICEIEFYLRNDKHLDLYTHSHDEQQMYGTWYFHRHTNGTYKGGTFKGLDFTLGCRGSSFSVLIRSITDGTTMIEGPCNVVNYILKTLGMTSIMNLTVGGVLDCFSPVSGFYLFPFVTSKQPIYAGKRVGLSDKYPDYRDRMYRFLIFKDHIKKQKTGLQLMPTIES